MKYLIISALILLMSQCNKYDNTKAAATLEVPLYTETGANTFGCMLNGAPWANFGETYITPAEGIVGSNQPNLVMANVEEGETQNPGDSVLFLRAALTVQKQGHTTREEVMNFTLHKGTGFKGDHLLNTENYDFYYQDYLNFNDNYSSLTRNPFTITVNKDAVEGGKRIMAGMFHGTLYNNAQTDSLVIVGGVFDATVH